MLSSQVLISPEHPSFAGHFPGHPILPGVVIIDHVLQLAATQVMIVGISQSKFLAAVKPGDTLLISINDRLNFTVNVGETTVCTGVLKAS
jgi:3-hydroxymyristoyl/3-hydroxydecanoyl-(acyl carrier protein) dehydratase